MSAPRAVPQLPAGAPEPLRGRVAVVSPHLDDGVLSLGATLAAHVRGGGTATVVTPFAGDPSSRVLAGEWDASAGFATQGSASRGRRDEDEAACRRVGAAPVHLAGADEQYPHSLDDDALWAGLHRALDGCDEVLLPGFPLHNADHLAATLLVLRRCDPGLPVRLYLEEPYALRERAPAADRWAGLARWGSLPVTARDLVAKAGAVRCYASQLPLLAPGRLSPPSRLGALVTQGQLLRAARARGEGLTPRLPAGALAATQR